MEKLTVEIDIQKMLGDILEKDTYIEGNGMYNTIQRQVQDELKASIRNAIVSEIKENLDIESVKEKGYTNAYLRKTAHEILEDEMRTLVKGKVNDYLKKEIPSIIERTSREYITANLVPALQKVVSNLVVINSEDVDEQIKYMEEWADEQGRSAYYTGQIDASEKIRKSL